MILKTNYVMTADELIKMAHKALNSKTLYVMGGFGAPGTPKNKVRYENNNAYNRQPARQAMIEATDKLTFFFDCVCLIKGILWGWKGDSTKVYGGAVYCSNGVPDLGADGMFRSRYCKGISKDFSKIKPGAIVHMSGHVGIYVGNGEVIESSPRWENCVQLSYLGNLGFKEGHFRVWDEYGYLPCVDYSKYEDYTEVTEPEKPIELKLSYTVKKGDTLTKIAKDTGRSIDDIVEMNKKKYSHISRNFIVAGWVLEV
ncbi:MAG: LysM peptidoglycan-binding domain-containing protein [Clostridiales bacterium]|nr:LysM peptidoglycan-binding domain-containing protein [Clostridiales bacterium]MBQ1571185.1 LysM peptidoglycan-binding domain-containing protein [Clostridiales bacterium]